MEKVRITICGRDYPLKLDESPERIQKIAKELENSILALNSRMTGKSEAEVVTMTALLMLDEADRKTVDNPQLAAELEKVKAEKADLENQLKLLNEEILSAQSEMNQIADVQSDENAQLRSKLQEYEQTFERISSEKEKEIEELRASFYSGEKEMEQIAAVKDSENEQLRIKLMEYEQTFERFTEEKEKEIAALKAGFESGEREMEQIADVRSSETEELKQKVLESEAALESISAEKDAEINRLKAQLEQGTVVSTGNAEVEKMRNVLSNYEKTFDEYVKTKEDEIKRLQAENEQLKKEKAEANA